MEALHALIEKTTVEKVQNQTSLISWFNNHRSELTGQIPEIREIQTGDAREHKDFLAEWRMAMSIDFQLHLLSFANQPKVQEISGPGSILSIQSSTVSSLHDFTRIHSLSQES